MIFTIWILGAVCSQKKGSNIDKMIVTTKSRVHIHSVNSNKFPNSVLGFAVFFCLAGVVRPDHHHQRSSFWFSEFNAAK